MVVIDDAVHRRAKEFAIRHGMTLSRMVEEGLRAQMVRTAPARARKLPPLPVYRGRGGLQPGLNLDDMKTVRGAADSGRSLDTSR